MGMRIQNEQSGSSSLWAQPMMLEPVVERQGLGTGDEGLGEQGLGESGTEGLDAGAGVRQKIARGALEGRLEGVIASLAQEASAPSATERQGHVALMKRWYYRPEAKRTGEICFPDAEGHWPVKPILRSIGRVEAKSMGAGRG
jgi:hypothetical protein